MISLIFTLVFNYLMQEYLIKESNATPRQQTADCDKQTTQLCQSPISHGQTNIGVVIFRETPYK